MASARSGRLDLLSIECGHRVHLLWHSHRILKLLKGDHLKMITNGMLVSDCARMVLFWMYLRLSLQLLLMLLMLLLLLLCGSL